jgi:hypothetical protein
MLQRVMIAAGLALAPVAVGQSLHLSYTVTDVGTGMYQYDFELVPCEGWVAGMAWRGLVWGDCESCPTPLTDFEGSSMSLPVGPWTEYTTISSEHNGPMFGDPEEWWEPATGDETLRWSGVSTADLGPGELRFSAIEARDGAVEVRYKAAVREGASECFADCDGSGALDFFDFLCFQNAFSAQDPYADCDGCGTWDIFDFLCFQSRFSEGCP